MEKQNITEKKWGLYPGVFEPEQIDKLDEIDLWLKIDSLGNSLSTILHNEDKFLDVSPKDIIEAQYSLEYLIYRTKKFGVEFSREPSSKEHIERSKSYVAWYAFFKNHFDEMSPEEFRTFVDNKFVGNDVSKYIPNGNWQKVYK